MDDISDSPSSIRIYTDLKIIPFLKYCVVLAFWWFVWLFG